MAKKKQKGMGFAIFMVIYAVVALTAAGFGLKWLWGCMEAYEASRPHIPIDAYMAKLTREHIVESSDVVLEGIDFHIQSEESCRAYLMDSISGDITYARKASACTDTKQVYVIRCGEQVVGTFTIESTQADEYGFTPWVLREEAFDLSFLMGTETLSVTIPEGYNVYVNGALLDESYIVSSESEEIQLVQEFYGKYEIPMFTLNTYEAGPFLNAEYEIEVYDDTGRPFAYDESFDPNSLVLLTDKSLTRELKDFVEEFVDVYVIFAGCANDDRFNNYKRVINYMVPDSDLAQRMADAVEGMEFAQSQGDEVDTVTIHHYAQLEPDTYMVDVTYLVNTKGREGVVQTQSNVKMVIVSSGNKLLVESMIFY